MTRLAFGEGSKRKSPVPSDRQGYGPRSIYGHLNRALTDLVDAAHSAAVMSDEEGPAGPQQWKVVERKQRAIIQRVRRMLNAKGPT